jgi:hypothetical protein
MSVKAAWMTPGQSKIAKPSWLRFQPVSVPVETPPPPPIEVIAAPSMPPLRTPSIPAPPPSSRRLPPAQIQTMREIELESEVMQLHTELQRVMGENENMRARVIEESEPAILALAMAIAKRVVGRELSTEPTLIHAWIREAQGLMPNGAVFVAADIDGVPESVVDPLLASGTAEVRDDASAIAVGADARLAAMADALGVDQ